MSFFEELKRRNVFRVGIAYGIAAWVVLQVADLVLDNIGSPDWVIQTLMFLVGLGFIAALIIAWAYELTPEGIKRETDVDRSQSMVADTGRKLDRIIIAFLAVAVVILIADRFVRPPGATVEPARIQEQTKQQGQQAAKTIAVLPFADLSQSQDQEWFADGLAEEILNALAKTPDLLVSSRTSSFRYKGSELDIGDIAKELGVANILEGSVRSSGDRIRVTAQLIRASDGFHVWSQNYDRDVADMIAIQEDLAVNIAKALETTMDPKALADMANVGTRSVEAYEEYLRGLNLSSRSVAGAMGGQLFLQAYEHFEKAGALDPQFANAHFQSAEFWRTQLSPSRTDTGLTNLGSHEALAEFNRRIDLAIASAPSQIEAQGYKGMKALVEMRISEAIGLFKAYLEARPNDEFTRGVLMDAVSIASDRATGREIVEHWRERGPGDVEAALAYANGAYRVIDPKVAADAVEKIVQRWPNHAAILYQAQRTYLWAGRTLEARSFLEQYQRLVPGGNHLMSVRQACAEGRRDEAERIFAGMDLSGENRNPSNRWHMLKLLGEDQLATEELRSIAESGIPYQIADMLGYPQFDPSPYPVLVATLNRLGINRPPAIEIPFKCPPPEGTSIAVLPFVNMSADSDNEFFSDGISEEILNVLASIPELKVAARTSAFAYKGSNTNISGIAKELGVNHILEGSVRKAGSQVRITAQLIKADDGFHLWSANYDRELTNIFAIQDEIANAIADALKVSLKLNAGESGNLTGTQNIAAYEHYLQGMSLWHLRTAISLQQSIEEFESAIALDPQFAKAHAGLALAWAVISGYINTDQKLSSEKTIRSAERALQLSPDSIEAMAALAITYRIEHRYTESETLFKKAIALNPSFATVHQWYASTLGEMGDPNSAMHEYRIAWSLDPRSRIIGYNMAYQLEAIGQRANAMTQLDAVLSFAPEFPDASNLMMMLQIFEGNCEKAAFYGQKVVSALKKPPGSVQVYLDLCQTSDPQKRNEAINTILGWEDAEFANPADPSLTYDLETGVLFMGMGLFDAFWKHFESRPDRSERAVEWARSYRTENGIRVQCDPRFQARAKELRLPPLRDPIVCP